MWNCPNLFQLKPKLKSQVPPEALTIYNMVDTYRTWTSQFEPENDFDTSRERIKQVFS